MSDEPKSGHDPLSEDGFRDALAEIASWASTGQSASGVKPNLPEGSGRRSAGELFDVDNPVRRASHRAGRPLWAAAVLAVAGVGVAMAMVAQASFGGADADGQASLVSGGEGGDQHPVTVPGTGTTVPGSGVGVDAGVESAPPSSGPVVELSSDAARDLCTSPMSSSDPAVAEQFAQRRSGLLDLLAELRSTRDEMLSVLSEAGLSDDERERITQELERLAATEMETQQELVALDEGNESFLDRDGSMVSPAERAHVEAGTLRMVMPETSWGSAAAIITSPDGLSVCVFERGPSGWLVETSDLVFDAGQRLLPRVVNVDGAIELAPDGSDRTPWLVFGGTDDDVETVQLLTPRGVVDAVTADDWWAAVLWADPSDGPHAPRFDYRFEVVRADGAVEAIDGIDPTNFSVRSPVEDWLPALSAEADRQPVPGMPDRTAGDVKYSCINTNGGIEGIEHHLEVIRDVVRPLSTSETGPPGLYAHDLLIRDEIRELERVLADRTDPGGTIGPAVDQLVRAGRVVAGPPHPETGLAMVMITTPNALATCTVDEFGSISWSGFVTNVFANDGSSPHPAVYARHLGSTNNVGESLWGLHGWVGPDLDSVIVTTANGTVSAVVQDGWWSAAVYIAESELQFEFELGPAGVPPFTPVVEARYRDGRQERLDG